MYRDPNDLGAKQVLLCHRQRHGLGKLRSDRGMIKKYEGYLVYEVMKVAEQWVERGGSVENEKAGA